MADLNRHSTREEETASHLERLLTSPTNVDDLHTSLHSNDSLRYSSVYRPPSSENDEGNAETPTKAESILTVEPKDGHNIRRITSRAPWLKTWAWELSSMLFSVVCMVALIILLRAVDQKPLSSWKSPISINAFISILNTGSKSSMLLAVEEGISQLKWIYYHQRQHRVSDFEVFDAASRGPLGSLMLLWNIRWKAAMASSGALLTLLALAMDPFVQEILSYQTRLTPSGDGVATIPIAQRFDSGYDQTRFESGKWYLGSEAMSEAVYRGLFTTDYQPKFVCTTGNCTWPEFKSVGICSECKDITEEAVVNCISDTNTQNYSGLYIPCDYYTPNNFVIQALVNIDQSSATQMAAEARPAPGNVPNMDLTDFAMIRFPLDFYADLPLNSSGYVDVTNDTMTKPDVYECQFRWCEIGYSARSHGARLLEESIDASPLTFTGDCLPQGSGDGQTNICTGWVAESANETNRTYSINEEDSKHVGMMLQELFNVSAMNVTSFNFPISKTLYSVNNGDINSTVQSIAQSMTTYIRQGPNTEQYNGTASTPETYVSVHWPWLSLPIALVLFSGAFLTTSIVLSNETKSVVWKGSTLAILFHGLSGWTKDELNIQRLHDIDSKAKEMWATLAEDDEGNVLLKKT